MKRLLVGIVMVAALAASLTSHHSQATAAKRATPTPTPTSQNCQGQQNGNRCCSTDERDDNKCCPSGERDDNKCCPKPYKPGQCQGQSATGAFTARLAGTRVSLRGTGTRATRGSLVVLAKVAAPHVGRDAQAFKLIAIGRIPALRLTGRGRLYRLDVATFRWRSIQAILGSGIYEAVFG
ncbi:MAG: hypothetical protein JOZ41_01380 [Chloroflexi bacterium]|nr:hypothetical protein [Chloroflexota bacterium]